MKPQINETNFDRITNNSIGIRFVNEEYSVIRESEFIKHVVRNIPQYLISHDTIAVSNAVLAIRNCEDGFDVIVHIADDDTREWFEDVLETHTDELICKIKASIISGFKVPLAKVYKRSIVDILESIKTEGDDE